jgi:hypothetical protein
MWTKLYVLLFILSATLIGGCVRVHPTYLASGEKGYAINCSAFMRTYENCLIRAGRVCGPKGYTIVYDDEVDRRMLVSCHVQRQ